ncbi:inorganic phosphate transporter 1-4 /Pi cotransporter [Leptodontidium sp. 2 PMI_412]|nr:inorganic phosphate transporter 1-4 /Pi cotransporter [Leptodontidium sp. 2 PMI_412]
MPRKFSIFWRNFVRPADNLETLRERKRDVYERIDDQKFGWKIVIVAGAGFLTDAYDIFAVNMVLPMLEIVYWENKMPASHETAINLATLVGTIMGQIGFGILADRYGRKKMYGFELLIVIVATVGLALCSKGAANSVNILAWVISWRILMGIGIGADYPLSAVIVSEFAPRKHRARMLATVFYMQPAGQLLANIVAICATTRYRELIHENSGLSSCVGDCMNATDEIWRWIVGLGAVIPSLALLARLLIPESPRYLLEVEKDSHTAEQNAKSYFTDPFQDPEEDPATVGNEIVGGDTNVPDNSADRNTDQGIMLDDLTNAEGHSQRFDQGQPLNVDDLPIPDPDAPPSHQKWTDGNWTDLVGTSATWALLDFSFYFLGINSWKVIAKIWDTPPYTSVYQYIIQFSWRALISVSVSSMIGGALFIAMAKHRHNLQMFGFLILAVFLIAVGGTFATLLGGRYFAAIIVLYFFTQLFFDFGPNTSTFVIPAEVFPTQYRATCHGISAASGKLGSIIAQIIAQVYLNDNRSKSLGWALIGFSALMIAGAWITRIWVPNPCDIYNESRSLEDLSKGKKTRKIMEADEKREARRAEQARYGNV